MVRLRRALPTALIYALVVLTLEAQSIWWDEGISLHLASLPWREILSDRAANIHPPLYFLLLKVWGAVVGLNPFSGRYLSALSVTLLPACVHRYVGRRAGSLAGRVAAVLVSIAPPFIIYGQEARAYALLPLGILGLWSLAWPVDASRPGRGGVVGPVLPLGRSRWVALGLVQATLLLTHYAGAVACAVAALAYGFRAARAPRGHPRHHVVREWVQGATLAAILMLPWVLIVARTGLEGMARQAGLASASADPVAAVYVAGLLGVFHTTGLPAALADRLLVRPSLIVGLLLAAAALWGALRVRRRAVLGASLLLWLVPLASAPLIWALSPQSHPRYLYPFVLGGWTTTAIVIGERRVPRLLRAGLLAAALSTSLLGIRGYFTRPSYARSDVRAVATALREEAVAGDVVIVPPTDWSLHQYDLGQATALMAPSDAQWDRELARLVTEIGLAQRVFVLDYERGAVDPRRALRVALTRSGVLTQRRAFPGVILETYAVSSPIALPELASREAACVTSGALCLQADGYLARPVSGAAVPVALGWRGGPSEIRYGVALRLYDPSGALVASVADLLVDGGLAATRSWTDGSEVPSYHVVPLPVGLLSVPYRLELGVFDWDDPDRPVALMQEGRPPVASIVLGDVVAQRELWRDTSMYGVPAPESVLGLAVSPSLELTSAAIDRELGRPGEVLFVSTLWRVRAQARAGVEAVVALTQDERDLDVAPLNVAVPSYPVGRPLLHVAALRIPASPQNGGARVEVRVEGRTVAIGEMSLNAGSHTYEVPSTEYPMMARAGDIATLVGFDVARDAVVGRLLPVTLYWRAEAGAGAADLKVFAHLLVDGGIVAQHDAVPAEWSRPTSGWIPGEIITDVHSLAWQESVKSVNSGVGALAIGFYDPVTGRRVLWEDGDDSLELPVAITVRLPE